MLDGAGKKNRRKERNKKKESIVVEYRRDGECSLVMRHSALVIYILCVGLSLSFLLYRPPRQPSRQPGQDNGRLYTRANVGESGVGGGG